MSHNLTQLISSALFRQAALMICFSLIMMIPSRPANAEACSLLDGEYTYFGEWKSFTHRSPQGTPSEKDANEKPSLGRFGLNAHWRHVRAPEFFRVETLTSSDQTKIRVTVLETNKADSGQILPWAGTLNEIYVCSDADWLWVNRSQGSTEGTRMKSEKQTRSRIDKDGNLVVRGEYRISTGRVFETVLADYSWEAIFKRRSNESKSDAKTSKH
jgi:hypothetical protein